MQVSGAAFQIPPVEKKDNVAADLWEYEPIYSCNLYSSTKLIADMQRPLSAMNEKRPKIKHNIFSEHVFDGAKKRKPRPQSNTNV